eukprot:Phypoly_transcript_11795.p1 GENE.Phypoly_transcript_11795~~Phypoly_transcript_11795.p1  ORF type:complete len:392 (-),score=107.64 Phypoly_transcript_11795:11-1138(-)
MTKKEHKEKTRKKSERHSERKFKRKLGKKLLKSVNGGLSKVKKKVALCKEHDVSIDFVHKKSHASSLHCAAILGLKDIAEYLIDNGAMIDLRDSDGNTPLHYAVKHHFPDLARLLVSRGANLHSTNQKGESPISLGVRYLLHLKEEGEDKGGERGGQGGWGGEEEEERGWRGEEEEFDWGEHLEAEYSDQEESGFSKNWREIEEEYKEMEDYSWMDKIAAQARQKFSRVAHQERQQAEKDGKEREKEEEYRRLLEEEIEKDKEWRERVRHAAQMNNSEKDEEKWVEFEDLSLAEISLKDVPWPSGPAHNILGIKENLPFSAKKQLVRAGLLRWHPDKFMQKFGSKLVAEDKNLILEKVKEISQSINHYSEKALSK